MCQVKRIKKDKDEIRDKKKGKKRRKCVARWRKKEKRDNINKEENQTVAEKERDRKIPQQKHEDPYSFFP